MWKFNKNRYLVAGIKRRRRESLRHVIGMSKYGLLRKTLKVTQKMKKKRKPKTRWKEVVENDLWGV